MGRRIGLGLLVGGIAILLLVGNAFAGRPMGSTICGEGYEATFNANEVGCTFCGSNSPSCEVTCLAAPTCFCDPGDQECCAATPCCFNCPETDSLACNLSSCQCDPNTPECCFTLCPQADAPAIGSPTSFTFTGVAAGLAAVGVFLLARRGGRRQRAQSH